MKLCSFEADGLMRFGAIHPDGGIVDLSKRLGGQYSSLLALVKADDWGAVATALEGAAADVRPGDVSFLPVFDEPVAIHCVGLNYAAHTAEAGFEQPSFPRTFIKVRTALVGHGEDFEMPTLSSQFDFEGELAVVIGRAARCVSAAHAFDYVAGYTCFMDGSVRDYQFERTTDQGKNFFAGSSMGPCITTPDEVGALEELTLTTKVNGETMQQTQLDKMIFPVATLIEYVSALTELQPGDVIATGTPAGVGFKRNPPLFLKSGDSVEVLIDRVGELRNQVA